MVAALLLGRSSWAVFVLLGQYVDVCDNRAVWLCRVSRGLSACFRAAVSCDDWCGEEVM